MAIQLSSQIITPPIAAIPSQTFDAVWIQSINIQSSIPGEQVKASIVVAPWNSTTNELYEAGSRMIYMDDVFAECAVNTILAQAMGTIFAAVQDIIIKKNTFGK